ncbi:MAG: fatty acid desaturase, partial [Candidatus Paceibacterota bacterium]
MLRSICPYYPILMINLNSISPGLAPFNSSRQRYFRQFLHGMGPAFILFAHLGCLLVLQEGLSLTAAIWAVVLYIVRMLGITAIYHRLITHRSYKAPLSVWRIGSIVAASSGQMGPSWWKAHHQEHHRYVDTTKDPHSPVTQCSRLHGFWH